MSTMTRPVSAEWLVLFCVIGSSCTSPPIHNAERSALASTSGAMLVATAHEQPLDSMVPVRSVPQEIRWNGRVSLLKSEKVIDGNSPFIKCYETSCGSWHLKNEDIMEILLRAKRIDGADYHNDFDVLPCQIEGTGRTSDSTLFAFRINAGSGIVILMQDTSFHLGYYGGKSYFLLGAASE